MNQSALLVVSFLSVLPACGNDGPNLGVHVGRLAMAYSAIETMLDGIRTLSDAKAILPKVLARYEPIRDDRAAVKNVKKARITEDLQARIDRLRKQMTTIVMVTVRPAIPEDARAYIKEHIGDLEFSLCPAAPETRSGSSRPQPSCPATGRVNAGAGARG